MKFKGFTRLTVLVLNVFVFTVCKSQTLLWSSKANPTLNSINAVAFKADGQKVISGTNCHPASIRMFDVNTGSLNWDHTVGGNFMCIMGVSFSANSNYIAAIEEMGNVFIFNNSGATPVPIDTINTGTSYAFSTAIAPTNDKVAVGCSNGKLKIYNIAGGTLANDINAHTNWVTSVAYSPDGTKIITGGSDDKVKIWSNTGSLLFTCSGHTGDITSVKVTPDNNFVVSSSKDSKIRIWNISTGALVQTISAHSKSVNGIDVSPDGTRIVSGSSDSTCKIWNLNTGALISTFGVKENGAVNAVAWSPLGDKIVTGSESSDVVLWRVDAPASIDEKSIIKNIALFPNPTQGLLNVEVPFEPKNGRVTIYDSKGQLQKVFTGVSSKHCTLDLVMLAQGQYLLKFDDVNGVVQSSFIVSK